MTFLYLNSRPVLYACINELNSSVWSAYLISKNIGKLHQALSVLCISWSYIYDKMPSSATLFIAACDVTCTVYKP